MTKSKKDLPPPADTDSDTKVASDAAPSTEQRLDNLEKLLQQLVVAQTRLAPVASPASSDDEEQLPLDDQLLQHLQRGAVQRAASPPAMAVAHDPRNPIPRPATAPQDCGLFSLYGLEGYQTIEANLNAAQKYEAKYLAPLVSYGHDLDTALQAVAASGQGISPDHVPVYAQAIHALTALAKQRWSLLLYWALNAENVELFTSLEKELEGDFGQLAIPDPRVAEAAAKIRAETSSAARKAAAKAVADRKSAAYKNKGKAPAQHKQQQQYKMTPPGLPPPPPPRPDGGRH
jgi:hypothetical protein